MADRWKELARAERKLEEKAAKGLMKLEKSRRRIARRRKRVERHKAKHHGHVDLRGGERHAGHRRPPRRRRPRTPEERAYQLARRRANAKIGFLTHFVAYASVLALILVT